MITVGRHVDPSLDKGKEESVERTPMHRNEVQELPEWRDVKEEELLATCTPIAHLLDGLGNLEPLRVQLRLEAHHEDLQSWRGKKVSRNIILVMNGEYLPRKEISKELVLIFVRESPAG